MTNPKSKQSLRGAALRSHLNKELRTIEDFNAETLRLEEEIRLARRSRNPVYWTTRCVGWGIFTAAWVAIIALILQPAHIKPALVLGFVLGTSGSALERKD